MARKRSRILRATRGKFGFLLTALIGLLVSAPVMSEGWIWKSVILLFAACVLVAGLNAVQPGKRSLIIGIAIAAIEFGLGRVIRVHPATWLLVAQIALWLLALTYVTGAILEWVLDSAEVTLETLQAAFCVYLLLGMFWAYAYALMQVTMPTSFRVESGPVVDWTNEGSRRLAFMRLFIFSYSTLTGTGRGELAPANGFADMAASLEAMAAQVYLAVVIARLVGLHAGAARPAEPNSSSKQAFETGRDPPA